MDTTNAPQIGRPQHLGFDRVEEITLSITVRCDDGRVGRLDLTQHGRDIIAADHRHPDGRLVMDVQIAADLLDTLPEWLRREIGYAALAAEVIYAALAAQGEQL